MANAHFAQYVLSLTYAHTCIHILYTHVYSTHVHKLTHTYAMHVPTHPPTPPPPHTHRHRVHINMVLEMKSLLLILGGIGSALAGHN